MTESQGEKGDKGEKGDRGQQGSAGAEGLAGLAGEVGKLGSKGNQGNRGNPGIQGEPGKNGPSATKKLLIMFIFMVIAFSYLAYRSEVNARHIEEDAYQQCVTRNANVERATTLYEGLIAIEQDNPYVTTSPSTVHRRIALYREAVPTPVDCGDKP